MEIAFSSKAIRDICECEIKARKDLGNRVAAKLKNRLADLRTATRVDEVIVGSPRKLDGELDGHMSIQLCDGYEMTLCANHSKNPTTKTGQVNWAAVSRVKIVEIKKYENRTA